MLLTAAALWLRATGSAAADVYDDNPATASRGPGELYVFARAADGASSNATATHGLERLGARSAATPTSGPAAVAYGQLDPRLRPRHRRRHLPEHARRRHAGRGWIALGGYATSAPGDACARAASNIVDLAVRGSDNAIWHRSYVPGTGWSGFGVDRRQPDQRADAELAGRRTCSTSGRAGPTARVYQQRLERHGVDRLVGARRRASIGAPAPSRAPRTCINVYVRGGGDALYARSWIAAGWSDWFLLDRDADRLLARGRQRRRRTTSGSSRAAAAASCSRSGTPTHGLGRVAGPRTGRGPGRRPRRRPAGLRRTLPERRGQPQDRHRLHARQRPSCASASRSRSPRASASRA